MIYTLLQVGTDAELFLRNQKTNLPIPVIGLLGGTKREPRKVPQLGKEFAVQEDNVMPEFNIPPADNAKKFCRNIQVMLGYLRKYASRKGLNLAIEASMHFEKKDLDHPQARTFGCEPDINAWTGGENMVDRTNPLLETMRTAAAHIHVSYLVDGKTEFDYEHRELAVRAHDLFIGVPSILVDSDTSRRQIYGKAGAFRITDYGHEYRTVSNFWIASKSRMEWVFDQTAEALAFASTKEGEEVLTRSEEHMDAIQDCINNYNKEKAEWLCNEFSLQIPA